MCDFLQIFFFFTQKPRRRLSSTNSRISVNNNLSNLYLLYPLLYIGCILVIYNTKPCIVLLLPMQNRSDRLKDMKSDIYQNRLLRAVLVVEDSALSQIEAQDGSDRSWGGGVKLEILRPKINSVWLTMSNVCWDGKWQCMKQHAPLPAGMVMTQPAPILIKRSIFKAFLSVTRPTPTTAPWSNHYWRGSNLEKLKKRSKNNVASITKTQGISMGVNVRGDWVKKKRTKSVTTHNHSIQPTNTTWVEETGRPK